MDLILEKQGNFYGFEVKFSKTPNKEMAKVIFLNEENLPLTQKVSLAH